MEVTMGTNRGTILRIAITLVVVSLLTACDGFLPGKKCAQNGDCGQPYCSENFTQIVSPTCVEGRCQDIVTECSAAEICVADSRGVQCLPKDPDTGKPIISCSTVTTTLNTLGINPFDPTIFMCSDDCPVDSFCNADCLCEEREEVFCGENTLDTEDFGGLNPFNAKTEMCTDDCPAGFYCDVFCICEEHVCPDPVFTDNYFDPPLITTNFDDFMDYWLKDPETLFDDLDVGDIVHISGYLHVRNGDSYLIPFPEAQLTLIPNPDNELISEEGWSSYCVNDYYDGDEALDLNYQWLDRPVQGCVWGGTAGSEGVISVCRDTLFDWFEYYTETY
jgi:hypothetical protein